MNPFADAARAVGRQVSVMRSRRWIARTGWVMAAVLYVLLWLLRRQFAWSSGEWLLLLGSGVLWLVIGATLIWIRRPDVRTALLTLDRIGGWRDQFCSAWDYQLLNSRTPGQSWHIQTALQSLPDSVARFPASLPHNSIRWPLLAMAIAFLISVLPWGRLPPAPGEGLLTESMQERAAEVEAALSQRLAGLPPRSGLTEEQAAALDTLRAELTNAVDTLRNPEGISVGELLATLDAAARSAEAMAALVGLPPEGWASPELIAAMEQQPDAADLAVHVRDKEPALAAEEADKLGGLLDNGPLRPDIEERLRLGLERIAAARTETDLSRPVGEKLGNAADKLSAGQLKTSAREFTELGRYFRSLMAQEAAQEGLKELASALREGGESVTSAEESRQQAQALATSPGANGQLEGLQPLDAGAMPPDLAQMVAPQPAAFGSESAGQTSPLIAKGGEPSSGQSGADHAPVPGSQPTPESANDSPPVPGTSGLQAPVPGSKDPSAAGGQGVAESEAAKPGDGGAGTLMAPVPGTATGSESLQTGGPSNGQPGGPAGRGGLEAGSGTAPLGEEIGEISAAQQDAEVAAVQGLEGESQMRSVEGTARAEAVQRSRQDIVKKFLAVEEQALDEANLPLTRRQHVIRYFSEIRRQFETSTTQP
jgi:hypothetical protein